MSKREGMQSDLLNNSHSLIEQPIINGHELLLFEADIAWNVIKGWGLNQYLNQRDLLFFNDRTIDKSIIKSIDLKCSDDLTFPRPLRLYSINNLFHLLDQNRFEKINKILRNHIWEAIEKNDILGISFLFNFKEYVDSNMTAVFKLERMLRDLFHNTYGFPIDCCCLYPSSIDVLDFAELVDLHDGYQIFDKFQQSRIQHHSSPDQSISMDNFEATAFDSQKSSEIDDSLPYIAKRGLSDSNSPFYFCMEDQIIGTVNNLESFYEQLSESVPLDVFCFHCYRMSLTNLAGQKISPSPRSDIALWIEYSVGDTQLAAQIFNTVKKSLGIRTLESASKFTQSTLKSTVLKIIKNRIQLYKKVL